MCCKAESISISWWLLKIPRCLSTNIRQDIAGTLNKWRIGAQTSSSETSGITSKFIRNDGIERGRMNEIKLETNVENFVWIEIRVCKNSEILVGCVYRAPGMRDEQERGLP